MKAHNVTVPKEIVSDEQEYIRNNKNAMNNNEPPMKEEDVVNVKKLGDLAAKQWVYGGLISPKLARLQATPLLLEIIENLTSSVTNSPQEENNKDGENKTTTSEARKHWPYKLPHKLSIFSGHDTTLSVLLAAMNAYKIYDPQNPNGNNINKEGYFDGHKLFWPGFGDYMSLELFKDNGTKPSNTDNAKSSAEEWPSVIPKDINTNGYYVRVLYNGNPVVLPKCTPKGQHHDAMGPSMCTLSAFFNQLGPVTTTYTDWSAECIRPVTDQDLPPIS
ncbi:hypothetical protein AX774_g2214 [Zancudomyces culisetae]|uniref:Acid phosphatase n=1 Tax=Zancudomyces culisetae TaxID=1213189 RepID=A0A1R1PTL8_ZANCU|nr:hypothetical protein AX774_g2214 [Zancudomyces culisetae]|eukprot:OMH84269.1 hypothetical protein AX774_g2214 [Zancudomyces culisetae]